MIRFNVLVLHLDTTVNDVFKPNNIPEDEPLNLGGFRLAVGIFDLKNPTLLTEDLADVAVIKVFYEHTDFRSGSRVVSEQPIKLTPCTDEYTKTFSTPNARNNWNGF